MLDYDIKFLRQLLHTFFHESFRNLAEIRFAIEKREPETLHRIARALKNSVANFGLSGAYERAAELELKSLAGNLTDAQAIYEYLEMEIKELVVSLDQSFFDSKEDDRSSQSKAEINPEEK